VAVGGQADGLAGLRRCYRRVGDLLAYGREVLPQSRLLTLNRYRAGDALAPSQRRRPG
jgi:carbohydrate diacid regulator